MPERPAARRSPRIGPPAATRTGVLAVAVAVGLLASPVPTHTWQATALTGVVGLVALAAVVTGMPRRTGTPSRLTARSVVPWVLVFAAVTVLELGALAWGDRPQYPTISWLVGPYFTEQAVRFGGYVVWICAGFWLVRR